MIHRQPYQPQITKRTNVDSKLQAYMNKVVDKQCSKFDQMTRKVKK